MERHRGEPLKVRMHALCQLWVISGRLNSTIPYARSVVLS
jgi:hypothetical protein